MGAKKKSKGASESAMAKPGNGSFLWGGVIAVVVVLGVLLAVRKGGDTPASPQSPSANAPAESPDPAAKTGAPTPALAKRTWPAAVEDEATAFAKYAGSESCRECHADAFNQWKDSDHGLAERLPNSSMDLTAFQPPRELTQGGETASILSTNDQFEVVALSETGQRKAFPVERVIGEAPLRQFLVNAGKGRLQTLAASYDPHNNEWFSVYGDEDRKPGEWGHWSGRGFTWNTMCASCHNTRYRKNYNEKFDTYHPSMAEMSVGCESCHGPMKSHVDWQHEYKGSTDPDPTLAKLTRPQMMDTCGTCHSRRSEFTGDFVPGDHYLDHYSYVLPNETDIYFPDGQVRDENYVFTSFKSSRMSHAGVSCMDCHNPHTMKPILPGNALCMRCHTGTYPNSPRIDPSSHSHHDITGAGGQCVNCHMPHTTYMQVDPRRDHGFTIPDPLLTKKYGVPNACNRCHTDKDTDWALSAVEEWYGDRMNRHTRERAMWIAEARLGSPGTRENLLKMLDEEPMPFWQSVAAGMLDPWVMDPAVANALIPKLSSTNAMLRGTVAMTLDGAVQSGNPAALSAVRPLLEDPIRKVRIDAAWTLRREVELNSQAGEDLVRYLEYNVDMPTGALQKGLFHLDRGEPQKALDYLKWAIKLDAYSAPLRHEYAIVLSMAGQTRDAIEQLQEAERLNPQEAEYPYKLALAWNEAGDTGKTISYLRKAVELNPRHSRAWYNLGLALNGQGKPEEAVQALLRAESAEPADPQIPYARATIHYQLRQMNEAAAAAARALEIEPNYQAAAQLLQALGAR